MDVLALAMAKAYFKEIGYYSNSKVESLSIKFPVEEWTETAIVNGITLVKLSNATPTYEEACAGVAIYEDGTQKVLGELDNTVLWIGDGILSVALALIVAEKDNMHGLSAGIWGDEKIVTTNSVAFTELRFPSVSFRDFKSPIVTLFFSEEDEYIYKRRNTSNPENRLTGKELKTILNDGKIISVLNTSADSPLWALATSCAFEGGIGVLFCNILGSDATFFTAEYTPETTAE